MKNNQLIHLIKTFDRREMSRFVAFSLSSYHHKHTDTQRLIDWLDKHFPALPDKRLTPTAIWQHLYGDTCLDAGKLAVLFTYASRLAEKFLIQEQFSKEEWQPILLLRALREHRQWDAWQRTLDKHQPLLTQPTRRDANHYYQNLLLQEEANIGYTIRERRREDNSLVQKEQALDHYYILEKLRDAVEMQVRRQILRSDYSARLLEAVLEELRHNADAYADAPAIQLYFLLYQMMDTPSVDAYRHAMEVFQAHQQHFQGAEVAAIYNYFQNFCIARINANDTPFLRELFQLYQQQLEQRLLHEDDFLIEWHYKNIVTTALRLGELAWADTFIEQHRTALAPDAAENAYRFNKAAWCHETGDYGRVLELLTQVEYSDMRYNLGAKALLLRTYYELQETEALQALVESFRQYLQRNRLLADFRRSGYYHLFRFTRRLARLREQQPFLPSASFRQSLATIREALQQAPAVFNRTWLEQKIRELEAAP
ncbi:MAG: hypothetical protein R2795_07805 [Saprospiraceae bacterium]